MKTALDMETVEAQLGALYRRNEQREDMVDRLVNINQSFPDGDLQEQYLKLIGIARTRVETCKKVICELETRREKLKRKN